MFYSFSVEGRCVLDGSTVGTIPATSSNASSEEEERFSSVSYRAGVDGDGDGGVGGGGWRVRGVDGDGDSTYLLLIICT